ncbi:hypothetical protein R3P38DRAFT_1733277 [Favolaschia claudopus]|uniref:phytol kinase n=1 Tax=Favolaschia claudopus TaxID=2862362 RepID=A0AAW0A8T8_9AGAR
MHSSLKLSNLSKFPPRFKKLAQESVSGSAEATMSLLATEELPPRCIPCLLPVIYSALDPAKIFAHLGLINSSTSEEDFLPNGVIWLQAVEKVICLRNLWDIKEQCHIPSAAFMDLWPRVWAWIDFLDEFRDLVPISQKTPLQTRYTIFLTSFQMFRGNEAVKNLMDKTPHLYAIVGRAWNIFLNGDVVTDTAHEPELEEDRLMGLDDVSYFLRLWSWSESWGSPSFEELVAGVGGTRSHLASLVVAHIHFALPTASTPAVEANVLHLVAMMYLVGGTGEESGTASRSRDSIFRDALLHKGAIAALTTAIQAIDGSTVPIAATVMQCMLRALVSLMNNFPRHKWVVQALDAGLLNVMLCCGSAKRLKEMSALLDDLLYDILPSTTVYHSVLSAFQRGLAKIQHIDVKARFGDEIYLELWEGLFRLVRPRLALLDEYDSGQLAASIHRACDNLECCNVVPKRELKCCNSCLSAVYCSRACQKTDWKAGHRQGCPILYAKRRGRPYSFTATKDRSFFRALVHDEYTRRREEVALELILFMHDDPKLEPYVCFVYINGTCELDIGAMEDLLLSDGDKCDNDNDQEEYQTSEAVDLESDSGHSDDSELRYEREPYVDFSYDVSRTKGSRGKLWLHLMDVLDRPGDEEQAQTWAFPIRYASGNESVMRGLREIAEELPKGANVRIRDLKPYLGRVRELLSKEEEGVY